MHIDTLLGLHSPPQVKTADALRTPSSGARRAVEEDLLPCITVGTEHPEFVAQIRRVLQMIEGAQKDKDMMYDRLILHQPMEQSDEFFFEDIKNVLIDWVTTQRDAKTPQAEVASILGRGLDPKGLADALKAFFQAHKVQASLPLENDAVRVASMSTMAVQMYLDDNFFLYRDDVTGRWGDMNGNSRLAAQQLVEFVGLS